MKLIKSRIHLLFLVTIFMIQIRLLLLSFTALLFTGCNVITNINYSNELFSLNHPDHYSTQRSDDKTSVTTEKGHLEIFKTSSFEDNPLGEPIHGYSSSGLDEFESKLVPKEKLEKDVFTVWLFYAEGDEDTKKELHSIFDSFSVIE